MQTPMRQYKLIDGEHEIEIPAMELAFQLSGRIDCEDFDNILLLPVGSSVTFYLNELTPEETKFKIVRTQ